MAYLSLRDIHKSYYLGKEEFPVLKGINLDFDLGDFVSILGESGGGKSTLMNIIGGLDRKFQGSVIVDGQKLDHSKEKNMDKYRRDTVGYIYQSYNLISHLTVLDNVKLALDMTKLTSSERTKRAKELLKRVGLADQMKKYPNQLSGGQKQRVAIARALSSDPKIIIADEPTGALDSQNTEEVLKMLQDIAKEGRLVIAVTHSQHVADAGTRIVHLADGKVTGDERLRPAYQVGNEERLASKEISFGAVLGNTWKHFKYHLGQNSLITAGMAIGLIAVLLFTALGTGVNGYVTEQINKVANPTAIAITRKANTNGTGGSAQAKQAASERAAMLALAGASKSTEKDFTDQQVKTIKNLKHVASAERAYTFSNVKVKYQGKSSTLSSVSSWNKTSSASDIKNGHKPGKGEVVLDRTFVKSNLGIKNYKSLIGKTVTMSYSTTDKKGQLVTVKFKAKVSGISYSTRSALNVIDAKLVTKAAKKQNVAVVASAIAVTTDKYQNVKSVVKKITNLKNKKGKKMYSALSSESMISQIQVYVNLISTILKGIAGISLVVSAIMIIVTTYMSVAERTKEIGILRALGESKRDIRRLFISESLLVGVISAIVATALSYGLAAWINQGLSKITEYQFLQIQPNAVGGIFVISLVISLLAALLPARHAANLNPIDALSND